MIGTRPDYTGICICNQYSGHLVFKSYLSVDILYRLAIMTEECAVPGAGLARLGAPSFWALVFGFTNRTTTWLWQNAQNDRSIGKASKLC